MDLCRSTSRQINFSGKIMSGWMSRLTNEIGKVDSAVVLMVVHKEEGNMYDQYWLALRLWELYPQKCLMSLYVE